MDTILVKIFATALALSEVTTQPQAVKTHFDKALRPHTGTGETDHFVEVFADKIPHTHGAPVAHSAPVTPLAVHVEAAE